MDEYNKENNINELNNLDDDILNEETLNPWLSIWTKPRKTIRYIINNNPRQYVIVLSILNGIFGSLNNASSRNSGDDMSIFAIFAFSIIAGGLGGLISLYVSGALINWTGKWIGGIGSKENIRAAIAWGCAPFVLSSILWIPELILFGNEMFTSLTPNLDSSPTLSILLIIFGVIEIIIAIWSFVVGLKCVGEVQGFSAWRALGNCLLAGLFIIIPIAIIILIMISMF
ncbi:Yip1 family protein [Anaerophilus nitritogenes]|uniref:Yip1 family protein n=1 Tax=Anaerophilus nitritogenes TaxID=2498136 RepID=UPI00101BC3AD|nr:Yip1 family protein [Anaerophilus nitritogenes]